MLLRHTRNDEECEGPEIACQACQACCAPIRARANYGSSVDPDLLRPSARYQCNFQGFAFPLNAEAQEFAGIDA